MSLNCNGQKKQRFRSFASFSQANHGGIRGKIPRKFVEDPDAFCSEGSENSDEELDENDDDGNDGEVMEVDKKEQVRYLLCK